jgi:YVTN family beta-propeller protein
MTDMQPSKMAPKLPIMSASVLVYLLSVGLVSGQYLETTIPLDFSVDDQAWNPTNNHLYVCNNELGLVYVIDGATNQLLTHIRVASYPYALCVVPGTDKVYCTSGERDTLSVIDGAGDTLLRSRRVRGCPDWMICNTLMDKVYVNCIEDAMVRAYGGARDSLLAELWFGDGNDLSEMLWHPGTNRLFCATDCNSAVDTVFIIDCQADTIVARIPIGDSPSAICLNPADDLVYVASKNHVHVLSPTGDSVVAVIGGRPETYGVHLCADPVSNKVYEARGPRLYVIDGASRVTSDTIEVSLGALVCDTRHAKLYGLGEPLVVIDTQTDSILLTIALPPGILSSIVRNSTDSRVYVLGYNAEAVYVLRDSTTGVAEPGHKPSPERSQFPTVYRGVLHLHGDAAAVLLDMTGRPVAVLKPGINIANSLRSGVYFVRTAGSALTRKVVIQN